MLRRGDDDELALSASGPNCRSREPARRAGHGGHRFGSDRTSGETRAQQYLGELDGFDADPSFDLYGGGGLVSTVDDLSTFYRALLRGDVFTEPETLDTMLQIPASNTETGAGMGIFRIDAAGNACWSHSGFWGSFVLTCPQIDVTIAASWNQAMPAADFDPENVLRGAFELATEP